MAERLVSNLRSNPSPVLQFPHVSVRVLSTNGDWFPGTEFSGKDISLSISGVLSELGKAPFVASWVKFRDSEELFGF